MLDLSWPLVVVQLMLAAFSFFHPRAEPMNTAFAMASLLVCGLNFGTAWVRRASRGIESGKGK